MPEPATDISSSRFLGAFNAKLLSTRKIAESFVTSDKFDEIAGLWHSLLIGPRGSGKTTLLRMLQVNSLRFWKGEEASSYRTAIDYTGIFVPADIAWHEMLKALVARCGDPAVGELFSAAAYTTSVFLAVVEAMEGRLQKTESATDPTYRLATPSASFRETLINICMLWQLAPPVMSLAGIRAALQQRMLEISAAAELFPRDPSAHSDRLKNEQRFMLLEMNAAVSAALDLFDRDIGDAEGRWALLLDEFEIAPQGIQSAVLNRLRSAGQKLLYKVGLAPCTNTPFDAATATSPVVQNNDFRQTVLWYADKNSARAFSEKIFLAMAGGHSKLAKKDAIEILGDTRFLSDDRDDLAIGKGIAWRNVFASLRDKDSSFAKWLENQKIDPDKLETSKISKTGNTVRKVAPLVAFRDAYRGADNRPARGRKRLAFHYAGAQGVFSICEGNPRWLIGLTTMMLSSLDATDRRVAEPIQTQRVYEASEGFSAMLTSVAMQQPNGLKADHSVSRLLSKIGNYFFQRLVNDDFMEEPALSFEVDAAVDQAVLHGLMIAFNLGAIVDATDDGSYNYDATSLIGKRFRLTYMLAPHLRLPLRATKHISLSSILKHRESERAVDTRDDLADWGDFGQQQDLFSSAS